MFEDLEENHAWMDLGKEAHIWGGISEQCTCHAPNATRPTRREYIMVSGQIVPKVEGCRTDFSDTFPVHWPVQARIRADTKKEPFAKLLKTDSADKALCEKAERMAKEGENVTPGQAKEQLRKQVHDEMDKQLKQREEKLKKAEDQKDTTRYWKLITAAAEKAFVVVLGYEGKQADKMRGRAEVKIRPDGGAHKMPKQSQSKTEEMRTYRRAKMHDTQANSLTHT